MNRFARRSALPLSMIALAACAPAHGPAAGGLWDAHTHLSWYGEAALDSLAAHGIAGVRDCGGDAVELARWRDQIARGERRGPRIYFSGPVLDGPKPNPRHRVTVTTPEQARHAVDSLAALGVDFIKTHNAISPAAFFAAIRHARARELKVTAHLPRGVPIWVAVDSGVAGIEHAAESLLASPIYAGYATNAEGAMAWWRSPAGDSAIAHLARARVAVTPTLVTYRAFSLAEQDTAVRAARLRVLSFLQELTGRLHRAGVPLLAGSDFARPENPLVPGRALHDEIALLTASGLSPAAARHAASTAVRDWLAAPVSQPRR